METSILNRRTTPTTTTTISTVVLTKKMRFSVTVAKCN